MIARNNTSLSLLFVAFLAVFACSSTVLALGVSPGQKVFDTPGEHQFTLIARNNGESGVISIRAEGDLASNITFDKTEARFDGDVTINGVIHIPEDIVPGDHPQRVIIALKPEGANNIGMSLEIASLIVARRLYPDAYLVLDAHATPDEGLLDTSVLTITADNRGETEVTPVITVQRVSGTQDVVTSLLPSRQVGQYSIVLIGRGEEPITIRARGAQGGEQGIEKTIVATIGHPVITDLRAQALPETGPIKPISITAMVDWNKPVDAVLTLNGKPQDITIDSTLQQTFYVETNETNVSIVLTLGRERKELVVSLGTASATSLTSLTARINWRTVALIPLALLVLAFVYLMLRTRKKQPPKKPEEIVESFFATSAPETAAQSVAPVQSVSSVSSEKDASTAPVTQSSGDENSASRQPPTQ